MTLFTHIKSILILCFLTFTGTTFADEVTYDFSTGIPSSWTSSQTPAGVETTNSARGTQFTANATLTLKGVSNVTKVVVTCSSNIADKNTLSLSVGGTTWGTETLAKEANVEKTFTGTSASGNLIIDITRAEKSIWIKKVVVTGTVEGGSGGTDPDPSTDLDENYTYSEPTQIAVSGESCSNVPYTFVQNNILVSATAGAQNDTYFGCNAGGSLTFTATKAIKAVVINGYVKKDFYAEADHGDISFVDASEDYVEANPVLVIKDVDSKSVSITCDKQLRCYGVSFYFVENPDIEIDDEYQGGGGDEGDYSYEWEPTTKSNLDIQFSEMEYADYTADLGYAYTSIFLASDDYEIEIGAFIESVEETVLPPGIYDITNTYADGTIQASPGGDEYYDYPTFIATGFEQDSDTGEWYYATSYYVVSGTLTVDANGTMTLNGKTYNGSTVKAVYTNVTSIKTATTTPPSDNRYHTLSGQSTSPSTKGILIHQGHKFINK